MHQFEYNNNSWLTYLHILISTDIKSFWKILMWLFIQTVPQKLRNQCGRSIENKERMLGDEIRKVERIRWIRTLYSILRILDKWKLLVGFKQKDHMILFMLFWKITQIAVYEMNSREARVSGPAIYDGIQC